MQAPYTSNADRDMVKRIRLNPEAYKELIVAYQRLVAIIVAGLIKDPGDRADIIQDIFLKVYENLGSFRFESKLSTWIGRIAYNTCIAALRRKRQHFLDDHLEYYNPAEDIYTVREIKTEAGLQPDELFYSKQTRQLLAAAIADLPPPFRTIVELYHTHEYSYEEISAICSLPMGTVKSYLYRSRQRLKEKLLFYLNKEDL